MTAMECPDLPLEVVLEGNLDLAALPALSERLADAVACRPAQLVIDVSACHSLYAPAIRLLVRTRRDLMLAGGRLTLRGCSPEAIRMLDLMGLLDGFVFEEAYVTREWARGRLKVV